jgi:adenine phosphoribosyltransferase
MKLDDFIKDVKDFPKEGVVFKDITPLLASPLAFNTVIDSFSVLIEEEFGSGINLVAGVEARGFALAAGVASLNMLGFIPVRKAGKLPPPVINISSTKEYGTDTLEVKQNPAPSPVDIIIIDDVLATGGTLKATEALLEKAGYNVVGAMVIIDLTKLHEEILIGGKKVLSIIEY